MPRGQRAAWRSVDAWVFCSLPCVYFLIYGFRCFGDDDHGFLSALSWRVLQGERIYLDFIYVRPPLSPYLHALVLWVLPDSLGLLLERLLFYLFMWGSVVVTLAALYRPLRLEHLQISPFLVGALAFVFSVNNFDPYPWHTLDGVFLGCVGLFLLSRGDGWGWTTAGMVMLVLSALTKQSYYPIPFVGLALAVLLNRRTAWRAGAVLSIAVGAMAVGVRVLEPDLLTAFRHQTNVANSLAELVDAGFVAYLESLGVLLPIVVVVGFVMRRPRRRFSPDLPGWILWGTVVLLLGLNVIEAFTKARWQKAEFGYSQMLFVLATVHAVLEFRTDRRRGSLLLAFLAVSWCSGISWATKNPLPCFAPVVIGCLSFLRERWCFVSSATFYRGLLVVLFVAYLGLSQFPYAEAPRSACVHPLGSLFPRFTGIHTGPWNFEQYTELKELAQKYGEPFVVLPAMPLAHYVTRTRSPLPFDWARNAELNYHRWEEPILRILDERSPTVFLQKNRLRVLEKGDHQYGSWISKYVYDHWRLVEERQHLLVYVKG